MRCIGEGADIAAAEDGGKYRRNGKVFKRNAENIAQILKSAYNIAIVQKCAIAIFTYET